MALNLFKVLQDELHRKILDSLLDFTRKCSSTRRHSDWASQMRASEIPTAALVLGMLESFDISRCLFFFNCLFVLKIHHIMGTHYDPDLMSCVPPSIGVNVPDHDMTFQSLSELLQQSVTPFVASVQAKECAGESSYISCSTFLFHKSSSQFMHSCLNIVSLISFSIEAFDEEGPGEDNGHRCGCR